MGGGDFFFVCVIDFFLFPWILLHFMGQMWGEAFFIVLWRLCREFKRLVLFLSLIFCLPFSLGFFATYFLFLGVSKY